MISSVKIHLICREHGILANGHISLSTLYVSVEISFLGFLGCNAYVKEAY